MKKINVKVWIISLLMVIVNSCSPKKNVETHYFNKYNGKNILEEKALKFIIEEINDSLSNVKVYRKDSSLLKFEQVINNKGVFRKFSNKLRPYYSFDSSYIGGTKNIFLPIINMEVWLMGKKKYTIDNEEFEVYLFNEMSYCTPSVSSYWAKNIGLISIYLYDGKKEYYYLCSDIKGNEGKKLVLYKLVKKLTMDTNFFKKAKYLPCDLTK